MKKLGKELKGKHIHLMPRMTDTNIEDNINLLSHPVVVMTNVLKKFEPRCVNMIKDDGFDVIVSLFSGDDIDNEDSEHYQALKTGQLYIELSWEPLDQSFWVERIGLNGEYENVFIRDEYTTNNKKEVFGFDTNIKEIKWTQ